MIKTIVFDLGGVVFAQNYEKAVSHFEEIGVGDAQRLLDDSERNIEAARALGIQTICPKDNADWTAELFQRLG